MTIFKIQPDRNQLIIKRRKQSSLIPIKWSFTFFGIFEIKKKVFDKAQSTYIIQRPVQILFKFKVNFTWPEDKFIILEKSF